MATGSCNVAALVEVNRSCRALLGTCLLDWRMNLHSRVDWKPLQV
jgi:hypothetical protein